MFKRYKSPYESGGAPAVMEPESQPRRAPRYGDEAPPRIFDQRPAADAATPPVMPTEPAVERPMVREPAPMHLDAEQPETTLGRGVVFKGTLNFSRLLRIDGHFEGDLISDGKLIVGPTGVVKSNIRLTEAIIEGVVEGNISARERVELRGDAKVVGNIESRSLSVDEGVTLIGHVKVRPEGDPADAYQGA
jgi:cytoskeletal protein CcmA (bactofilin family)